MNLLLSLLYAASWTTPATSLAENAIIYFNTTDCPPGYTRFTPLEDRFALAAGNTYILHEEGGNATKVLTIDQMPPHEHLVGGQASSGPYQGDAFNEVNIVENYDSPSNYFSRTTSSAGAGLPVEMMPPYYTLTACFKPYPDPDLFTHNVTYLSMTVTQVNTSQHELFYSLSREITFFADNTTDLSTKINLLNHQTSSLANDVSSLYQQTEALRNDTQAQAADIQTLYDETSQLYNQSTTQANTLTALSNLIANLNLTHRNDYLTLLQAIQQMNATHILDIARVDNDIALLDARTKLDVEQLNVTGKAAIANLQAGLIHVNTSQQAGFSFFLQGLDAFHLSTNASLNLLDTLQQMDSQSLWQAVYELNSTQVAMTQLTATQISDIATLVQWLHHVNATQQIYFHLAQEGLDTLTNQTDADVALLNLTQSAAIQSLWQALGNLDITQFDMALFNATYTTKMTDLLAALNQVNATQALQADHLQEALDTLSNQTEASLTKLNETQQADTQALWDALHQLNSIIITINTTHDADIQAFQANLNGINATHQMDFQALQQTLNALSTTQQVQFNIVQEAITLLGNYTNTTFTKLNSVQEAAIQQLTHTISTLQNITAGHASAISMLRQALNQLYNKSNTTQHKLVQKCGQDIDALFVTFAQLNKSYYNTIATTASGSSDTSSASEEHTPCPRIDKTNQASALSGDEFSWSALLIGISIVLCCNIVSCVCYCGNAYRKHRAATVTPTHGQTASNDFVDNKGIINNNETQLVEMMATDNPTQITSGGQ